MKREIILVDDEESIRELFKCMLEALGHEVTLARNGYEAIDHYRLIVR